MLFFLNIFFVRRLLFAYNSISGQVSMAGVKRHCPDMARWAHWCLNGSSRIYYTTILRVNIFFGLSPQHVTPKTIDLTNAFNSVFRAAVLRQVQ